MGKYEERKEYALNYLGGKCVVCGSTENLQFDHIDGKKKRFYITKILTYKIKRLNRELDKCQLLCEKHHREKTAKWIYETRYKYRK